MSRKDEQVPKPEDWLRVQSHIRQLYVVEQRPLKDVSRILAEQHDFHATQRMYKSRIQAWKYDKKFKEAEWRQIIAIWQRRREDEGKDSVFKVRGRTITTAKIRKFLKRKKIEEGEFLASMADAEPLSDIICTTPTGSPPPMAGHDSPSAGSNSDHDVVSIPTENRFTGASSNRGAMSEADQTSSSYVDVAHRTLSISTASSHPPGRTAYEPISATDAGPSPGMSSLLRSASDASNSSSNLVFGIEGMALRSLTPDSFTLEDKDDLVICHLLTRSERPPILVGDAIPGDYAGHQHNASSIRSVPARISNTDLVLCNSRETGSHSGVTLPQTDFRVSSEETVASRWLSRLFQACIFNNQRRNDLVAQNVRLAGEAFETMVQTQNQYLLSGLSILTGIMTAHNQWDLATTFLRDCCQIARNRLGPNHPFTVAFEHMRGVCGPENTRWVNDEDLRRAITTFELAWAQDHPNTIVLKYYWAWDILRQGNAARAEDILRHIFPLAEKVMGRSSYITTSILRTLSRSLADQGRLPDAIGVMSEALERNRVTLGPGHPERLESVRRLAGYYEWVGNLVQAENCLQEAFWGQVRMIGVDHTYTMGTLEALSRVMKQRGRDAEETQLQRRVDELFKEDEGNHFEPPPEAY